jgi:restriction system protein
MAQPSKRQRGRKAGKPLWKNGLIAAVAGAGLLMLASAVAGKHPFVATAVSMPAWWALGLGALLMLMHLATRLAGKRRTSRVDVPGPACDPKPNQPAATTIKALIDQIERETLGTDTTPSSSEPEHGLTKPLIWREEMLTGLDSHRFVALCEAIFSQAGFATRLAEQDNGDGVDIWLDVPTIPDSMAVVQCLPEKGSSVDVASIRALQKRIRSLGLRWGACITLADYTTPAMALASSVGIHVLEAQDLLLLISRRSTEQQALLLKVTQEVPS